MTAFNVYQNQALAKHSEAINALGWDQACQKFPAVKAHLNCSTFGAERWSPVQFSHYAHVLVVDAENLEQVFIVANQGPSRQTRVVDEFKRWSSLSVGDIVELNGVYYMVDTFGFEKIDIH